MTRCNKPPPVCRRACTVVQRGKTVLNIPFRRRVASRAISDALTDQPDYPKSIDWGACRRAAPGPMRFAHRIGNALSVTAVTIPSVIRSRPSRLQDAEFLAESRGMGMKRRLIRSSHLRVLLRGGVSSAAGFGRNAAHLSNSSSAGHIACPHLVKAYSTLGGTCGCTVRVTMRSRSSSRTVAGSAFFERRPEWPSPTARSVRCPARTSGR